MGIKIRRTAAASAASLLGLTLLAACGGSGGDTPGSGEAKAGGTLYVLQHFPFENTDPQRAYYGVELSWFRRMVYRSLVAFPMSEDPTVGNTPIPDLATDTGTPSDGARTWTFTLKDGVKWQDGSPITCEDFRYGASRVFANDLITGGPNYILSYLDVKDYPGPYKATQAQQAAFDKAIECSNDNKTITYHFNKPWADFPLAVAALSMMDPYKQSEDQGAKSQFKIFSNGPYKLDGAWSKNQGATFVRNDEYDPSTDTPDQLRKALPDSIVFEINTGDTASTLFNDRLIADAGKDQYAITTARVTPAQFPQVEQPNVKPRFLDVDTPYDSYLVPNFKKMTNPVVRQALAMSTDLNGYVKALGGDLSATPGETIVAPALDFPANPAFADDNNNDGDPAAAKALMEKAGIKLPVPLKVGYQASTTYNKAFTVLANTWKEAGFDVQLAPLTDTYYDVINKPDDDYDVTWAGWGADWPSAMTVLPPLFDSRPNFSSTSCGQDYGCYESDAFNKLVDEAANASNVDDQKSILEKADLQLGKDYAYIPLEVTRFPWLFGSKVTGFTTTPASSAYPEIGLIGVEN